MKKYILLLSVFCLGLVSCMKEDMPVQESQVTFKAGFFKEPSTRTVLQGMTPHWSPADEISIYDGKNNRFLNTGAAVSAKTSFKGKLEGQGRKYYLAAYPYNEDISFAFLSKGVYGMQMPQEQTAVEDGYDPKAAVAIAYTLDNNLSFKNVCSLIKFRSISEGVESVTLQANAGEKIAGKFNATWSDSPRVVVTDGVDKVTLKGDFKKDAVYYITTVPAVLTEGITVTLNGSVITMKETYQIDLSRSGMSDLGDLSLDPSQSQKPVNPDEEDEAVASDWILLGEHNEWSADNGTPMYEIGSNFVAFDVPASVAEGFKFNNGDTWVGTKETVALDQWIKAQGEGGDNISFTAAAASLYDIYLVNSLGAFYITEAGSPSPAPAPKPFVGMAVAGTFNSWSTSSHPAVESGDYYVLKGFKAAMASSVEAGDKGFKFVYSEEDGSQAWYGASSAAVSASKWYNVNSDGAAANIYVSGDASADYDVYITKDRKSFCVVPAGGELPASGSGSEGGSDEGGSGSGSGSEAELSGWYLPGGYNGWDTTSSPLYDKGEYFVAENVMLMGALAGNEAGFKFHHADYGWKGGAGKVAAGQWHSFGGNNITLDENVAYDVYMSKDGLRYCIVKAGSQVPEYVAPEMKTIYLDAGNGLWNQGGAWIEVWHWADGVDGSWARMTLSSGNIFEVSIPKTSNNIIFHRRGPDMTSGWELNKNFWDTSGDQKIPSGKNCFTITGWGVGGTCTGSWSSR